ncbi:MAG: hypothetical protein CMH62_02350 [Nanoarchaeota archaeon]|nr:hypothetical protein [Nanoarchaeota archaeon]
MYILAAIILSIAIFSVMKVTNNFVSPVEDNFDFFVENFEGEKSYVMNLGYLEEQEGSFYLKGMPFEPGLLEIFQDFGINVGLVLIEYKTEDGWIITNYLGEIVSTDCEGCETFSVPTSNENAADVSFSLGKGGKKWRAGDGTSLGELGGESKYFQYNPGDKPSVTLNINENDYVFDRPSGSVDRTESLIFRNIDKNYVKIVKV